MRSQLDMIVGAIAAIILDYAAVACVIGLLVLDRWFGIRRGIALDTLLVAIVALGAAAWLAGSRFDRHLTRDIAARTDANRVYCPPRPQISSRKDLRKRCALDPGGAGDVVD